MSIESWIEEFYPEEAWEAERSDLEALKHSLRKWEGLAKDNAKRHDVNVRRIEKAMWIDSSSCALCYKHMHTSECRTCPIFKSNGVGCADGVVGDTFVYSEWGAWVGDRDPQPMIDILRKLVVEYSEDNREDLK